MVFTGSTEFFMAMYLKLTVLCLVVAWVVWKTFRLTFPAKPTEAKPMAAESETGAPADTSSQQIPGRRLILLSPIFALTAIALGCAVGGVLALGMLPLPLLLLWAYPVLTARLHWHIYAGFAKICAGLVVASGLVVVVAVLAAKGAAPPALIAASIAYLLCSVTFAAGVLKYAKAWSFDPGVGRRWIRFKVPVELAQEFNTAFALRDQDELVADWMRQAIRRGRRPGGAASQATDANYTAARDGRRS